MKLRVPGRQGGSVPKRHLPACSSTTPSSSRRARSLSLAEPLEIRHVLLLDAHLDHTGGLAYLADNRCCHRVSSGSGQLLTVAPVAPVVEDLP